MKKLIATIIAVLTAFSATTVLSVSAAERCVEIGRDGEVHIITSYNSDEFVELAMEIENVRSEKLQNPDVYSLSEAEEKQILDCLTEKGSLDPENTAVRCVSRFVNGEILIEYTDNGSGENDERSLPNGGQVIESKQNNLCYIFTQKKDNRRLGLFIDSGLYSVKEAYTLGLIDEGFLRTLFSEPALNVLFSLRVPFNDERDIVGDINNDDKTDVSDATALQKLIAQNAEMDKFTAAVADKNEDGIVDIKDVTCIQRSVAGM